MFSYIWTVIVNLITVVVVFMIYDNISGSFEKIVISLLVLIYLSVQGFSMAWGKTTAEMALALDNEFKKIRKLSEEEKFAQILNGEQAGEEERNEAKNKLDKAVVKFYITSAFILIIYIISLFNLFGALE